MPSTAIPSLPKSQTIVFLGGTSDSARLELNCVTFFKNYDTLDKLRYLQTILRYHEDELRYLFQKLRHPHLIPR